MRITEFITESKKPGLWANIHAKQDRIKHGSSEHMRKPGSKGAPTAQNFKDAANEAANPAQQAAIAINMKKRHQKPKNESGYPDVDHMNGPRGINLPSAPTKKFFTDKKQWAQTVDDINSSKYDDNSEYTGVTGRSTVSIDGHEWARWSDAQQKGYIELSSMNEGETWSKHNNPRAGGMSKKSVSSYRRSHPGSKIQTAVTTKPSKLKKGSKAANRRKSFCARMRGMKKHRTGAKTAHDPNSNINKSLRRWHCESIEQLQELVILAEQYIAKHKKEVL